MRDILNKYKKLLTEDSWDLSKPTLPHGGNDVNDCFSEKHDYRTDGCCGKCDKYMEPSHPCYDFCNEWTHCCEMSSVKESKQSLKNLITEQGSGFVTTIKCPSGFSVQYLNNPGMVIPEQTAGSVQTLTIPMGQSVHYTCYAPNIFAKKGDGAGPDIFAKKKELQEAKELSGETEMEEFAEKRGNGAEKISDSAKEKGGLSLLTYNHFRVKLPYYKKASEGKLSMETAKKEYDKFLNKLYSSTKGEMNLSQTAFQELMGKIEVLGELLLESDE